MRAVERGHPLFGPACDLIRAEALIRIDCEPPLPSGLLALGQRTEQSLDARHGSELLMFLGRSLARYDPPVADRPPTDELTDGIRRARSPRAGAAYLQHDRRRSPHTVRAYVATAHRFVDFLGRHRGEAIGRFALAGAERRPTCAPFLPTGAASGLGAVSAARELSAVRALPQLCRRAGRARSRRLPRTRAPEAAAHPAAPGLARRRDGARRGCRGGARRADGSARATWRSCCCSTAPGLRVAEALSLTGARAADRADDPGHRQAGQDPVVPLVPAVARGDRGLCRGNARIR